MRATIPSETHQTRSRIDRIPSLDVVRTVAAVGVVWLHALEAPATASLNGLGAFAVPFFILSTGFLAASAAERKPDRRLRDYAAERLHRVYLPFAAWTVLYLLIRNLKHLLLRSGSLVWPSASMALAGSTHHLWFLPFALIVCLAAFGVARLLMRRSMARWVAGTVLAGAGILAGLVPQPSLDWAGGTAYFFSRAWLAMPAMLWGLALWALRRPAGDDGNSGWLFLAAGVLFAGAIIWVLVSGSVMAQNLAGLAAFLAAFCPLRGRVAAALAQAGGLTYGVYLLHVAFVEGLQTVLHRMGHGPSAGLDLTVFLSSLAGAAACTTLFRRWRATAWLFP